MKHHEFPKSKKEKGKEKAGLWKVRDSWKVTQHWKAHSHCTAQADPKQQSGLSLSHCRHAPPHTALKAISVAQTRLEPTAIYPLCASKCWPQAGATTPTWEGHLWIWKIYCSFIGTIHQILTPHTVCLVNSTKLQRAVTRVIGQNVPLWSQPPEFGLGFKIRSIGFCLHNKLNL